MGMTRALNDKKICIIMCANDDFYIEENLKYLQSLQVPDGYTLDIICVRDAASMTEGYQSAMESSDAKYKLYIHQDTFIVNKNCLADLLHIFNHHPDVGIIGMVGSSNIDREAPIWWNMSGGCGVDYIKRTPESMELDLRGEIPPGTMAQVAVLDGIFLATQYDLPWRTDLFHDWHFYDLSQTREFINAGYKAVVPYQAKPWTVHAAGRKLLPDAYFESMEIFKQNYSF